MYSHASETGIINNILCLERKKIAKDIGSKSRSELYHTDSKSNFFLSDFLRPPLFPSDRVTID